MAHKRSNNRTRSNDLEDLTRTPLPVDILGFPAGKAYTALLDTLRDCFSR